MNDDLMELEVQLTYLKSDLKNVIAKKQALDKMKNKCNEWIGEINNELEDANRIHLEIKAKISLLKLEMKNTEEMNTVKSSNGCDDIPVMTDVKNFNEKKWEIIKGKVLEKAINEATKILGCDPMYYGEEGNKEIEKQIIKMGYYPEQFKMK